MSKPKTSVITTITNLKNAYRPSINNKLINSSDLVVAEILSSIIFIAGYLIIYNFYFTSLIALASLIFLIFPFKQTNVLRKFYTICKFLGRNLKHPTLATDELTEDISITTEQVYSIQWDGNYFICGLKLSEYDSDIIGFIDRDGLVGSKIDLSYLINFLFQFDIVLTSVELVTSQTKVAFNAKLTQEYLASTYKLPALANQEVFLFIRFNPNENNSSILRHGGGYEGAKKALAFATARIADFLKSFNINCRGLNYSETIYYTKFLFFHTGTNELKETWKSYSIGKKQFQIFEIKYDPNIALKLLSLWSRFPNRSILAFQFFPGFSNKTVYLRILISLEKTKFITKISNILKDFNTLAGKQLLGYQALRIYRLPKFDKFALTSISSKKLTNIQIPISAFGQFIGYETNTGKPVGLRLKSNYPFNIGITAPNNTINEIILTAICTGIKIMIFSDNITFWKQLVNYIGNPKILAFAPCNTVLEPNALKYFNLFIYDTLTPPTQLNNTLSTIQILPIGTSISSEENIYDLFISQTNEKSPLKMTYNQNTITVLQKNSKNKP